MLKKFQLLFLTIALPFLFLAVQSVEAASWKPPVPDGFTPISWAKAKGVATFMKMPEGNGYLDYLTIIYLPYNQVKFIASSTPPQDWGPGKSPFGIELARDWAFPKIMVEKTKLAHPEVQFMWNIPYFNITLATTDLSLSLKSTNKSGIYLTSGSRPDSDVAEDRKMLIVDNKKGTAEIDDFDADKFASTGDQAVESFSALVTKKGTDTGTARLFVGVRPGGKELVVYCSQGASPAEASAALLSAGVPVENQLQADGGTSATCAYNMPGQYFVEPGRTLSHLMGAITLQGRGVVNTKTLNVRSGAGPKFEVVRQITKGEPVMIFKEQKGWLNIGEDEWVSASLVKKQ